MKRCSKVLIAATGLVLSLLLSGCGTPPFVAAFCKESLAVPLARAAADGLQTVQESCRSTFKAQDKINMCIYSGQRFLNSAKSQTLPDFVQSCGDYVVDLVCGEESNCYKHPDKMTTGQARVGVKQYVDENSDDLKAKMKVALDAKIHDVVAADYNSKFNNRAIPLTVQAQCGNEIDQSLGINPDIKNDVIKAIYRKCERYTRGVDLCQTRALTRLEEVERREKNKFKERCARAALAKACPRGSACGLDTSGADTTVTGQEAVNWLLNNFGLWKIQYKNSLMSVARSWRFNRKFDMFFTGDWQGNTLLAMVSIGAAIAGVGCVVAVVRFVRKRTTTRTITTSQDTPEAMELIEDLEE